MDAPERIWIDTERLRFDSALRAVCDAEQFPDGSSSDVEYVRAAALAAKDAEIERLRARIAEKDEALAWIAERTGGFCPGSWESGISAPARKALEE